MNLPLAARTIAQRLWNLEGQDRDELRYVAAVSIWVRWALHFACLVESSYRVEYGSVSHVLNTLYVFGVISANGCLWWNIRASGRVDRR